MSNDMLDRDHHLERLLHDTLRAQAATVNDGPTWSRDLQSGIGING